MSGVLELKASAWHRVAPIVESHLCGGDSSFSASRVTAVPLQVGGIEPLRESSARLFLMLAS